MGGVFSAWARTMTSTRGRLERRPDSMLAITLRGIGWPISAHLSAKSCALQPSSFRRLRTSMATVAMT